MAYQLMLSVLAYSVLNLFWLLHSRKRAKFVTMVVIHGLQTVSDPDLLSVYLMCSSTDVFSLFHRYIISWFIHFHVT